MPAKFPNGVDVNQPTTVEAITASGAATFQGNAAVFGNLTIGPGLLKINPYTTYAGSICFISASSGGTVAVDTSSRLWWDEAAHALNLGNGVNLVFGTTAGTQHGTATNQKQAFFGATPIVQPSGNALDAIEALGLVAPGSTLAEGDITGLVGDLGTLASAITTKAPTASPTFSGTVTVGTLTGIIKGASGVLSAATGSDIPNIAESQVTGLVTDLGAKAPLASPTFTGTVTIGSLSGILKGTAGAVSVAVAADIPDLAQSQITGLVTDLGAKAPLASPTFTGTMTVADMVATGAVTHSAMTAGSIPFYGTGGLLTQDNQDLSWDSTAKAIQLRSSGTTAAGAVQVITLSGEIATILGSNIRYTGGSNTRFDTSALAWQLTFDNRATTDAFYLFHITAAGVTSHPFAVDGTGRGYFGNLGFASANFLAQLTALARDLSTIGLVARGATGAAGTDVDIFDARSFGNTKYFRVGATGALSGSMDTVTYAATISLDVTKSDFHKTTTVNATGNATINASTGGVAGQWMELLIVNDATSAKTITFGTNFKVTGTVVGTVSKAAALRFRSDGTSWWEMSRNLVIG